jgi:hypothetical protein
VCEDTLAAGDGFCFVQCTVGLLADLMANAATVLQLAQIIVDNSAKGKTRTLGFVCFRGFG